ncbi:unnamed protein product [Chrysoparadoxa australica]
MLGRSIRLCFPIPAAAATAVIYTYLGGGDAKPPAFADAPSPPCEEEDFKNRLVIAVVGDYQERIRRFSNPQKTFEFFASVQNDQGTFMSQSDFARACTPCKRVKGAQVGSSNFKYNYKASQMKPSAEEVEEYTQLVQEVLQDNKVTQEELRHLLEKRKTLRIDTEAHMEALHRAGATQRQLEELLEERAGVPRHKCFEMVDVDGDGLVGYEEYMMFHALLALPSRRGQIDAIFRMFDTNGNDALDALELEAMLRALRQNTNAGKAESRDATQNMASCAQKLVGKQGHLSREDFISFVLGLQDEVLHMQFEQWDLDGNGTLSASEFARFLGAKMAASRKLSRCFLERAASPKLEDLDVTITPKDFVAFHHFLHYFREMEVVMDVVGSEQSSGLDKPELLKAARAAVGSSPGLEAGLPESIVDVLMAVIDCNGNGRLEEQELLHLIEATEAAVDPPRSIGVLHMLRRVADCTLGQVGMLRQRRR